MRTHISRWRDGDLSACCRLAREYSDALLIYEPIQYKTAMEDAGGHCPATNKLIGCQIYCLSTFRFRMGLCLANELPTECQLPSQMQISFRAVFFSFN